MKLLSCLPRIWSALDVRHISTPSYFYSLWSLFFFYHKGHIYCVCADIITLPETAQTGSSEAAFLRTSLLASKAAWAIPTLLLFNSICLFYLSPTVHSRGGSSVVPLPLFAGLQMNWLTSAELKICSVLFFNSLTGLVVSWVSESSSPQGRTGKQNSRAEGRRQEERTTLACFASQKYVPKLWPEAQSSVRTKAVITSLVPETFASLIRMIRINRGPNCAFRCVPNSFSELQRRWMGV